MKKVSKKALNKSFWNWYYGHLTCFSQEHMQTFGYLCAMLPIVEEKKNRRLLWRLIKRSLIQSLSWDQ